MIVMTPTRRRTDNTPRNANGSVADIDEREDVTLNPTPATGKPPSRQPPARTISPPLQYPRLSFVYRATWLSWCPPRALNRDSAQRVSEVVGRERPRLRNWIRHQLADPVDVDDILQDVFVELVVAYRALKPIEDVTAWLFRVARNRITDLFRKNRPRALADEVRGADSDEAIALEDLLPALDPGRKPLIRARR